MSRTLRIAPTLTLPLEAVTDTFGVLAVRGAGKSNTAAVMAEEMFKAKLPFVVVDPEGSWWGLRSSGDGKGPGLPIPIFGGVRGDVPLERGGGALVADLVAEHRLSCVLDLDGFDSEGARKQFLLDFARRLYAAKQRHRDPLHLFLEEADDYIPQKPMREEAQLLRAWENIVRRGRKRGIGCTLITQRSAVINKNVLYMAQTLIAMRTTGPGDRDAIEGWVKYHGQSREIVASLSGLKDGEAWVWSPNLLRKTVRVRFRMRETFDSAATPKVARARRAPATLADVDLGAIQKRMASTIEKAKAEDSRELRRRVAELERELAGAKASRAMIATARPPKVEVRTIPALRKGEIRRVEAIVKGLAAVADRLKLCGVAWSHEGERLVQALRGAQEISAEALRPQERPALPAPRPAPPPTRGIRHTPLREFPQKPVGQPGASWDGQRLPPGEKATLTAAAQHPDGVYRDQLSVLTGYKRSSRDAYIQRLREKGLVTADGDRILATQDGVVALGDTFQALPSGEALRDHWMQRLPPGEKTVLHSLIQAYPNAVNRDSLSEATQYARSSRDAYIQRLKARRLVELVGRGEIRASATLFS